MSFSALRRSIKLRVTLATLAIFLIAIWSLTFYASRMLRADMARLLGEHQFSTASILAAEVEAELTTRIRSLETVAAALHPTIADSPQAVQTMLDSKLLLLALFNKGIAAFDAEGTAIADAPPLSGRRGANFMDRDYVRGALLQGRPVIGKPVVGKVSGTPIMAIAVPIRDAGGGIIGALAGVTDLGEKSFLENLGERRYGKRGGYLVISTQHRLVLTASDKSRVMTPLAPPGTVAELDRFAAGFEGFAVYVNSRGEEVLTASKGVPAAQWNIAVTAPIAEIFAPIHAMQRRMLAAALALTLLSGMLTWWIMKQELAPVFAAVQELSSLAAGSEAPPSLPVRSDNEIGRLIGAFNSLLASLRQREGALKASEAKLAAILESVDAHIYLKDTRGRYLFANRRLRELYGCSNEEIIGAMAEKFLAAASAAQVAAEDRPVLEEGRILRTEHELVGKDGSMHTFLTVKLPLRDEAGQIYALCGISTDITERKRLEEHARQLAFYDELTDLPNRRLLEDRLSQAMAAAKRSGSHGALMFLDLDHFKSLNDEHGHAVGDLLLKQAAARLKAAVRATDTVARFGGDEFVILLGALDRDRAIASMRALAIAEKLRAAIAEPFLLEAAGDSGIKGAIRHRCSASIGVALIAGDEASREDLLKRADAAMYRAKEGGRNMIRFFDHADRLARLARQSA